MKPLLEIKAKMIPPAANNLSGKRFEIRSDNPAYPMWRDCDLKSVSIIGRVVWAGRRIS